MTIPSLAIGILALLIFVFAMFTAVSLVTDKSDLHNATISGSSLDDSKTVNAENSGSGNTQLKGLSSGADMNINLGNQSGN